MLTPAAAEDRNTTTCPRAAAVLGAPPCPCPRPLDALCPLLAGRAVSAWHDAGRSVGWHVLWGVVAELVRQREAWACAGGGGGAYAR